jgi:hypothetical protein
MKHRLGSRKENPQNNAIPIRTTIMDLLHLLSDLTQDDRLVISAFESIFESYDVRLAHSSLPIRLVGCERSGRPHGKNLGKPNLGVAIASA